MPVTNSDLLTVDARNRAIRTALVGLAVDVTTALALVLYEVLNTAGDDVDWRLLPALLLKTAVVTAVSYWLRVKGDALSWVPVPLPPTPPGEPADHTPGG